MLNGLSAIGASNRRAAIRSPSSNSARYLCYATDYYRKDGRCTRVTPAIKACIKYLRDWYGREMAVDFGPLALKAVRQRMVDDGLSRRYVNDHAARIKRMFKWAVGEQLIPVATYQALTVVPGLLRGRTEARETAPVLPVDDSIVDATLPHLPAVVADMVRLYLCSICSHFLLDSSSSLISSTQC